MVDRDNGGAVVEAEHYREERAALEKDPILIGMLPDLRGLQLSKLCHDSGTPRHEFMMAALEEYRARGGKEAKSIGSVARVLLALLNKERTGES